jgi:hypothetical protein
MIPFRCLATLGLVVTTTSAYGQAPAATVAPLPTAPPPAPVVSAPTVAIFAVHVAPPIDPRVAVLARTQLEKSAKAIGYSEVPEATTKAVAARSAAQGAMNADRAADLVRQSGATRGIFASIQSANGRYVASVQVVGDGPARSAKGEADATALDATLDRLLRSLLPPPSAAPPPAPPPPFVPPEPPEPEWPPRFRLALKSESAIGMSGDGFYNHLLGARLDRRFTPHWAIGLSIAYANLKGKDGRAHNVLPMAELEYRAILSDDWAIPIRFGSGYLPKNGPVVRVSAGIGYAIADDMELALDLIAPTGWVANERVVLSLDLAAELGITF